MKPFNLLNSLRIKLLLPVVLAGLFTSSVITLALLSRTEGYLHEVASSRAEIISAGLREVLASRSGVDQVNASLGRWAEHWLLHGLAVTNAEGRVIASSRAEWIGQPPLPEHDTEGFILRYAFEGPEGGQVFVYLEGEAGWQKVLNSTRLVALLLMFSIGLVVLVIIASMEWTLFRPMRGITSAMQSRREGAEATPLRVYADDELGEVSRTLEALFEREDEDRYAMKKHNSALREFNGLVSHDLKQPIRQMSQSVELVLQNEEESLSQETRSCLQRVTAIARSANSVLDSLLRFSQLELAEHSPQACDLRPDLCAAVQAQQAQLDRRELQIRIPEQIPMAFCNRELLGRVFDNLIANAIKYNDQDTVRIDVSVEYLEASEQLLFRFRDNGIGIAREHRERVFQAFRRLHPESEYGGGTGSGLALVSRILAREGGRVWIEDNPKQGSCFCFVVPAAR